MNKFIAFSCLLLSGTVFSQDKDNIDGYLSLQYNATLYDRTILNNRNGFGLGADLVLNTSRWIRPALQVNGNLFGGTKVFYITTDGKPIYSKETVTTVFGGLRFDAGKRFFSLVTAGAAFYNGATYFGIRPSLGYYTSDRKKLSLSTSFTNIFQRDEISNEAFGYVSFALALKFL